jgi:hypothetical protein
MRRTTLTPSERSKLGMQIRNELRKVVDENHQGLMVWVHNSGETVTITNIPEGPITTTVGAAWHRIHRDQKT